MTENKEQETGEPDEAGLRKYLSPINIWALSLGCAVGWGAFVMPGSAFLPIAGPVGSVLALFIGGLLMLVIAANLNYMANHYPHAGGIYAYTRLAFGYDHSFLCAWALGLAYLSVMWANATSFVLIARKLFGSVLQLGFHYQVAGYDVYFGEILLTVFVFLFFGLLSCMGKTLSKQILTALAVIMVLGSVVCFLISFAKGGGSTANFSPAFVPGKNIVMQIFNIAILAPWAFVGFEAVVHSSDEYLFSYKKLFRIMALALLAGVLIYILMTALSVLYLPEGYENWQIYISDLSNLEGSKAIPTFYAVETAMGKGGFYFLIFVIIAAVSTTMIGLYHTISRLLYSMSRDEILPKQFSRLNKNNIPVFAIRFIMLISMIIPFFGRTAIGWIVDITTISAALAYGYASACTFRIAKREENFRMKFCGIFGIVISAIFFGFPLIPNFMSLSSLAPESYMMLVFWGMLGFLAFRLVFQRDRENRFGKSTVVWIALLFLIFFASTMWIRQATHVTTETVIGEIDEFYDEKYGDWSETAGEEKREDDYLERQMDKIRDTLMENSLIQMFIILLSLLIMFSIYSTLRKRERRMDAKRMQAEESSKAKSHFLFNMSHDIRTPMNAIIGYTNLARNGKASSEEIQEYLKKIDMSGKHLLALIDDVLEMSRVENGKMELTVTENDLVDIMDSVRDMFHMQMEEKHIHFSVDSSRIQDRYVYCDKHRFDRVLLNLISNALKFTPENGFVVVRILQKESEEEGFGNYELHVKDSGIGMSKEFAEKVFTAFERERTSTVSGIQGTGLGMAITKSIIDLMGGVIRVETAPGKGTEFIVSVPFRLADEPVTPEASAEENTAKESIDFSRLKVLLVEDNEINQEIATLVLEEEGMTVEIAADGKEGLEKVADSEPGFYDVVLMDVQMPVMNGYDATRAIRKLENKELANIPVIAMTANAYAEDIKNAEEAGVDGHIAKPFEKDKLLALLEKVLTK